MSWWWRVVLVPLLVVFGAGLAVTQDQAAKPDWKDHMLGRYYWKNNRLFALLAIVPVGAPMPADALRVLDSLKFIAGDKQTGLGGFPSLPVIIFSLGFGLRAVRRNPF